MKAAGLAARLPEAARAVVLQRAAIVAVPASLLHLGVVFHVITPELSAKATNGIAGAIDGLGLVVTAWFAMRGVTPSKDPRDANGVQLVPVTTVVATSPARDTEHGSALIEADLAAGPGDAALNDGDLYPTGIEDPDLYLDEGDDVRPLPGAGPAPAADA